MFNHDFDPYDMLVSCHNQIKHHEQTIKKLINHVNAQETLISQLAETHADFAKLHHQNAIVVKNLLLELEQIKNNASN